MRWYHDPETGKHEYTVGECTPGYVPGYIFDATPKSVMWAHDPETGKSWRFENEDFIPDTFVRGRGQAGVTRHLNKLGSARYLNLVSMKYEIVEDAAVSWFHVPTHGKRLSDFKVLVWNGVHYLTLKSVPEHLKPLFVSGDDSTKVQKPHWNASSEANEFRKNNFGKSYKESGISMIQLSQCKFLQETEVRH